MEILLVGAGAIGSWIGANLVCAGNRVTFVGRAPFVDAVRAGGLRVSLPDGVRWEIASSDLRAYSSVRDAVDRSYDAVLLCVKTYALEAALAELQPHAEHIGRIVTFQNGVGAEECAAKLFGVDRVTAATLTSPVSAITAGEIALDRLGGGVGLADCGASDGFAERMRRECATPQMPIGVFDDARAMKWSKMLLNIVGNATSALFDRDVGAIYADRRLFAFEMRMVRECLAVMRARRIPVIDLPGYSARAFAWVAGHLPNAAAQLVLARRVARGRGGKRPSFYYDVAHLTGRSEIGALNGSIADEAQQLGIAAPVNRWLTDELLRRVRQPGASTLPASLG